MTIGEAISLIARRIGQRGTDGDLRSSIRAEMASEQLALDLSSILPWFMEKRATVSVTNSTFTLPTDFVAELASTPLVRLTSGQPLKKREFFWLEGYSYTEVRSEAQDPLFYCLLAGTVHLFPKPTTVSAVELVYSARQTFSSSDGDTTTWLTYAPKVLIGRTGLQMAKLLRAPELAMLFQSDHDEGMIALMRLQVAREVSGQMHELEG